VFYVFYVHMCQVPEIKLMIMINDTLIHATDNVYGADVVRAIAGVHSVHM